MKIIKTTFIFEPNVILNFSSIRTTTVTFILLTLPYFSQPLRNIRFKIRIENVLDNLDNLEGKYAK